MLCALGIMSFSTPYRQINDFPEQCWADTLFMAAFFMLRAGVMFERPELVEDALNQWYWHIQYLQNERTGLWYHGYDNIAKDHMSGIFTGGRANCWAAFYHVSGGSYPSSVLSLSKSIWK